MDMSKNVRIGDRLVGEGEPAFIIAEIGANHDRKLPQAKELVDVAVAAGADAVKFQIYSAETLYSAEIPPYASPKELGGCRSPYEMIKQVELPRDWLGELADYCRDRGIICLASPFDKEAVDQMDALGLPAYKWASYEIVDLPLLRYAAAKGKPMLLSTGMCNLAEIQEAIDAVHSAGNQDIVLFHCTSLYPTRPDQVNLRMMDAMRAAFSLPVGFSDHTMSISIPAAAVVRGACVIEKHFTISRKLKGPDHPFAMEPEELKQMVVAIREVEAALGSEVKQRIPEEAAKVLRRRSIMARCDISWGTRLTEDMLIIKRPGYGIQPKFLDIIIGREVRRNVKKDEAITWDIV